MSLIKETYHVLRTKLHMEDWVLVIGALIVWGGTSKGLIALACYVGVFAAANLGLRYLRMKRDAPCPIKRSQLEQMRRENDATRIELHALRVLNDAEEALMESAEIVEWTWREGSFLGIRVEEPILFADIRVTQDELVWRDADGEVVRRGGTASAETLVLPFTIRGAQSLSELEDILVGSKDLVVTQLLSWSNGAPNALLGLTIQTDAGRWELVSRGEWHV